MTDETNANRILSQRIGGTDIHGNVIGSPRRETDASVQAVKLPTTHSYVTDEQKNQKTALEQRLREAEQELKQAAETYVVALDVSEQTWRKEVEAAEQRAERYKTALEEIADHWGEHTNVGSIARAALAEPQET